MTQVLTSISTWRVTGPIIALLAVIVVGATMLASSVSAQTADARLRVLHASPDAPAVDVYLDGAEAISDLAFDDITDYVSVPAGAHTVEVFPASADGAGDPVIDASVTLDSGVDYTVAAVGQLANLEPLVIVDDNSAPAAGQANLRFVHASPDAPAVDIYAAGAGVVVPAAAFKDASGYLGLDAATYDLEVRAAGTETVALDLPGIALEEGNTYTAFAVGLLAGTPELSAKLTVDAAAPAAVPAGGGPIGGDSGTSWALWLAAAGALLVGLALTTGLVAIASTRR
ncbi:MAG TPA: DUF4397 domain-containing protein [Dehalococcoidia bacterium]